MSHYLETDRLLLTRSQESHWAFLLELVNSPKWIKNIGDRNVHTEDDARNYLKNKIIPNADDAKSFGQLCIVRKSDNVVVGVTGLYQRDGLDHADIGFALLPEYEGMGYAYEATKKLLDHVIQQKVLNRIEGITLPSNIASQGLLEKLGLQYERMVRIPNDEEELMLYATEF